MLSGVEAAEATASTPRIDLRISPRRTIGAPAEKKTMVDVYVEQLADLGENEAANKGMYVHGGLQAYMKDNHPRLAILAETGLVGIRLVAGGYAEDYARWR